MANKLPTEYPFKVTVKIFFRRLLVLLAVAAIGLVVLLWLVLTRKYR